MPNDNEEIFDNGWRTIIEINPMQLNLKIKTNGMAYEVSGPGIKFIIGHLKALGFSYMWIGHNQDAVFCLKNKESLDYCIGHKSNHNYQDNFDTKEKKAIQKAALFLERIIDLNPDTTAFSSS